MGVVAHHNQHNTLHSAVMALDSVMLQSTAHNTVFSCTTTVVYFIMIEAAIPKIDKNALAYRGLMKTEPLTLGGSGQLHIKSP